MIDRTDDGDVAVLALAHGPVNAMDIELCQAVAEQFRALVTDPAQAVVLTGSGRAFSAGVDLRRYLEEGPPYVERFLPALTDMFRAAFELAKPVVSALNGHAIAGGCVLAATADVTVMAEGSGRIGVPEIKVGVPFPRLVLEILAYTAGPVSARKLVLGAATYGPADAQALGLVDEVVAPGDLLARAVTLARGMAADVPADTFAATKTALRRAALEQADRFAGEDAHATRLWSRRASDGWTAAYLKSVTGR